MSPRKSRATGAKKGRPIGERTKLVCEALDSGPLNIAGITARTGLTRNEAHKVAARAALMGLTSRDKSYTPQRWSVISDWREAIERADWQEPRVPKPRNIRFDARALQGVWGSVVGLSQ